MKKSIKFAGSLLIAFVLLFSFFNMKAIMVNAAGNDISTATKISIGENYSGDITYSDTKDVYSFTLSSSGRININLKAYIQKTHYYIYDSEGVQVWSARYQYWNEITGVRTLNTDVDLTKGTYYFAIERCEGEGDYNFTLNFKSASESFTETLNGNNQEIRDADEISVGTAYKGQLAANDNKDIYRFTLSSSGRITLNLKAYIQKTHYYIYDSEGVQVWSARYQYWNETTKSYTLNQDIDLTKGTYYFAIERYEGTGNYNFTINFKSASESFTETLNGNNQEIRDADEISVGTAYKGQLAANDNKDIYRFTLSSSGRITLNLKAYIQKTHYYIYDSEGVQVWSARYQYWNETTKSYTLNQDIDLTKGTYYFAIERYEGTGNYNFTICAHKYSNSCDTTCNYCNAKRTISHSYKTVVTKATLTANGKKQHKCTVCGYVSSEVTTIARPISFKLSTTSYTYNGTVRTPSVIVKDSSGKTLTKGTDYTVTYASGRKNVGTYKVTVTMKGKYSGTQSLTFKINPISISKCKVSLSTTAYTYNGSAKTPNVIVKNANGTTLTKGTHYTVTYASGRKNVGTYKVTVKMKGNYSGTKSLTFKINPISISKCKVSLSTTAYTYNGSAKTPNVIVKNANGTTLTKGTHYTVTYASGRKNVGTYKVTVKMKGNYSGTKTLTFKVIPPKTTVSKLTPGTKKITVAITKKSTQVTGYQVQYSTSKTFSKATTKTISSYNTTKTTLTGLSAKKTYYVRVRTYKTVNGTKYYSGWSTCKYTKTK